MMVITTAKNASELLGLLLYMWLLDYCCAYGCEIIAALMADRIIATYGA